jgi:hypothetical protein
MILMKRQIPLLFILVLTLSACNLVDRGEDSDTVSQAGVLVANGGNFGDQDGFITRIDPNSGTTDQTPSLNGFLQGLEEVDGKVYALLNTFSVGRIAVLNGIELKQVGQIDGLPAPRSMAVLGDVAYVSNLIFGSNGVLVPVNLASGTTGDPIEVGAVPEGVTVIGTKVYVANNGNLGAGQTVSVVTPGTGEVSEMTLDCDGPRDLITDTDNELIVVCSGSTVYNSDFSEILSTSNGTVLFIDPATGGQTGRIELSAQAGATNGTSAVFFVRRRAELLVTSGNTDRIFRIDTERHVLIETITVPEDDSFTGVSGIAYDTTSEIMYIGRFPRAAGSSFPDFSAAGIVISIDRSGEEVARFSVGPAPSQIMLMDL